MVTRKQIRFLGLSDPDAGAGGGWIIIRKHIARVIVRSVDLKEERVLGSEFVLHLQGKVSVPHIVVRAFARVGAIVLIKGECRFSDVSKFGGILEPRTAAHVFRITVPPNSIPAEQ